MLLDYNQCVFSTFLFPIWTPVFYAKVSILLSMWHDFYFKVFVWVHTCDFRPIPSIHSGGWEGCCIRKVRCAKLVVGVDSSGWGYSGVHKTILVQKTLLCQAQYQTRLPVWILGTQGTWDLISAEYQGVRPRDRNCDLSVNPIFNVKDGFFHFRGHESSYYNLKNGILQKTTNTS